MAINQVKKPVMPGQIWWDEDDNTAILVCSKEENEGWKLKCFQELNFGAYDREFEEEDFRSSKLHYIGHIADLDYPRIRIECPRCGRITVKHGIHTCSIPGVSINEN